MINSARHAACEVRRVRSVTHFLLRCVSTGLAFATPFRGVSQVMPPAPAMDRARQMDELEIYVSPAGNDAWSGRLATANEARTDGPLATVIAARERIRALKAQPDGLQAPMTVLLRGGTYSQAAPLVFTPADSGTEAFPVTYAAYPGEVPLISGGVTVGGWERDDSEHGRAHCGGNLWQAPVPKLEGGGRWRFNQLFVNGERRTRARMPNRREFFRTDGPVASNVKRGFHFRPDDMREWGNLHDVMVVVYHSWETSIHHIRAMDVDTHAVLFRESAPWPMGRWERNQRYYVENAFEALDEPGEWYVDQASKTLYYYPLPDEDMDSAEVVAPVIGATLIEFKGEPSRAAFVEHLRFRGLSFRHTNANLRRLRNPSQGEIFQAGLIQADGLRHASFVGCEIAHSGGHGIWLASGCTYNRIEQCHIHSLAGGGVYLGGGSGVGEGAPTEHNTVSNCFIHDGSYLFRGAHGVWIGKSSHNTIIQNEISNFDYSAVSCGWSWGFQPSSAHHNQIDLNYIHHLGNGDGLSDMGAIYTLGISPGTTIRGNHIHDVYNYAHVSHGSGIYPDEGSSEILIENNVVYRVRNSPLLMHYGRDCVVRNNIFAFGGKGQLHRSREDRRCHYIAEGNIVYGDQPAMLSGRWRNGDWQLGRNVYWSTTGKATFAGMDFAAWQVFGKDVGSIVADPLFEAPGAGNFRLQPDSPALALGFQPIDPSHAGLRGDPAWVNLPKQYANRPLKEVAPPSGLLVNFDFESEELGSVPVEGHVVAGENGASVLISDEASAGGTRSLKFTDAPNQRHDWTPHIFYKPFYDNGVVQLFWDMLNNDASPAEFYLEVRQYRDTGGYLVGPRISVAENGAIMAGDRLVGTMPLGQWTQIEITLDLDTEPSGAWQLVCRMPDRDPIRMQVPFANKAFRQVNWLGIASTSQTRTVFYIDNLKMGTPEELARPPRRYPQFRQGRPLRSTGTDDRMLAAHWTFDEDDPYTVRDHSGCGNDGELLGHRAKGSFGMALLGGPSGHGVTVEDHPSLHFGNSDFTIDLWLCPTQLAVDSTDRRRRIMGKSDYPRTWWVLDVKSDGVPLLEMRDADNAGCSVQGRGTIPEHAWTYLAVVVDRSTAEVRFYLDGILDHTAELPRSLGGNLDVRQRELFIAHGWQSFVGLIDEVRIHGRALGADEIAEYFAQEHETRHDTAYEILD